MFDKLPPKWYYNQVGNICRFYDPAGVAELADAHDSKSCGEIRAGSSPATGMKKPAVTLVFLQLQSRRLDDKLINTWKIFENNDFSFPISRVTGRRTDKIGRI